MASKKDGQRIRKAVTWSGGGDTTWYVRDAQGNVMAIYKEQHDSLFVQERYIYGSSRMGSMSSWTFVAEWTTSTDTNRYDRELGNKQYELTNHLGNVLATITDQKKAENSGGSVDYWNPVVVSYSDYYPGGSLMPGRNGNTTGARHGFNGMEKDNEVYGEGNSYTAEFWQYDSRLLRRWNVDPVTVVGVSPYNTFRGNPILLQDPKGNLAWHPETNEDGETELVEDAGDDVLTLSMYLNGVGDFTAEEKQEFIDQYVSQTQDRTGSNVDEPARLGSDNNRFNNLVGRYLANKFNESPEWRVTTFPGDNCSPTTFNRVDKAVEFVYGTDKLGRLTWGNPIYQAWQGIANDGYSGSLLYGTGISSELGLGRQVTRADIIQGNLTAGAILDLHQTPGPGGTGVSWHTTIFLNYTYNDVGVPDGVIVWDQVSSGGYTRTYKFDFDNRSVYSFSHGYKPRLGLNFE